MMRFSSRPLHTRAAVRRVAAVLLFILTPAVIVGQEVPTTPSDAPLGAVQLPRDVRANGERLPRGTYQVRLTARRVTPEVAGETPGRERWVELVRDGQVRGREVITVIPVEERPGRGPADGRSRVELLKDGDYLRVWLRSGDAYYLLHLPVL